MADSVFSRPWWRKLMFQVLGFLVRSNSQPPVIVTKEFNRILVLTPVLRGDYLVVTPLLGALRDRYPESELAVVVTKPSLDLASVDPAVSRVLLYHKLPRWFFAIREIIQFRAEVVFLPKPHPAFTESMLMLLSGAKIRIGLSHPHHNGLLTHPVPHRDDRDHRAHTILRLVEPLGINPKLCPDRLRMGINPSSERFADQVFEQLDAEKYWISINLSAANARRQWSLANWRKLLTDLIEDQPELRFLVLSAPSEVAQCQDLANQISEVTTVRTGSFLDAVALIARTRFLVSPDTGVVHASVAKKVPLVVLYNGDQEVFHRFEPLNVSYRAVLAPPGAAVSVIEERAVLNAVRDLMATELSSVTGMVN